MVNTSQTRPNATHASIQLVQIPLPLSRQSPSTSHAVLYGHPITPQQRLLLYSSAEWEEFIHEWAHYQKSVYSQVLRMTGAGDMGIDIAGCTDTKGLTGVWDNYQCKHYNKPLSATDAFVEIGKILWHSFHKQYAIPRAYYFVAPKGCGTRLVQLLSNAPKLKSELMNRWDKTCSEHITTKQRIHLVEDFHDYVTRFNFSIFKQRTLIEILDSHRQTPYHVLRFGGGLPSRPSVSPPPRTVFAAESRYTQQLLEAYSDHKKEVIDCDKLTSLPDLESHFGREREHFYHAESLRNFARDNVPQGTFEELGSSTFSVELSF